MDKTLEKKTREVLKNSYSPYSKFRVGATIKTANNQYFSGCNVENASYGLTFCAESNAIGHMVAAGETLIKAIYITSDSDIICPPCGACRQMIREFADENTAIHMVSCQGEQKTLTINELLPFSFDKDFLTGNS